MTGAGLGSTSRRLVRTAQAGGLRYYLGAVTRYGQQRSERALRAPRLARAAEVLPYDNQLRMEVLPVIQPPPAGLLVQRRFAQALQVFVAGVGAAPPMPLENAFCVSVNHEAVMPSSIEQHAVCRFGTDTVDGQEALAHDTRLSGKQPLQV